MPTVEREAVRDMGSSRRPSDGMANVPLAQNLFIEGFEEVFGDCKRAPGVVATIHLSVGGSDRLRCGV